MPVQRRTKIAAASAAVVIAIPVAAVIVLLNYDWNRAKPWLNARASEALGRPFAIGGDLSLTWSKVDGGQDGWRRWVPWPHLLANDVHLGNPQAMLAAGGKAMPADMASVGALAFSLDPLALLNKKISIPEMRFTAPQLFLQNNADGNNWTFDKKDKPSPWQLELQNVVLAKGSVHYIDSVRRADMTAQIDTIADPVYGVQWTLRGKYNGENVSGSGKAGAVLSLQKQVKPYPIAADIKAGGTSMAVVGSVTRPTELAALDMRLRVSGPSMARLYGLTGIVLPETPHFSTEGHLTGTVGRRGSHWIYDQFSGKVGSSDIAGKLDFQQKQPRNVLTGAISSRLLQLSDLGPLIGADSNASKRERGAPEDQPAGKFLPVETFKTERWTSIDADVRYQAARITRDKNLPISNLDTHFILNNGVLSLLPLNFDIAGGKWMSEIRLDGSGKVARNAIRAELKANARHIKLQQLFPTLNGLQASAGEINADTRLTATGNSVASLLGTSNGEVKALIDHGTVSKLLLEEMGLNIGNVVISKLFGDKQVKMNCMAADFAVTQGLMQTRSFIVDTEEAVLNIDGTVNLANERLDLTLKPDSKSLRIFSLRSPLYVRGTFGKPAVSVDKGALALRAGGALALFALAPVAALLPLINTGPGQDSACGALLANARVKPVAPPPGKPMPRPRK